VTSTAAVTLTTAREACAAALELAASDDVAVLLNWTDSLDPPALMVGWADPWLEPQGTCRFVASLCVWCVAGRLEPGPGVSDLEGLVSGVIRAMSADGYGWGLPSVSAPRIFPMSNVEYLAAQVTYRVAITANEGP